MIPSAGVNNSVSKLLPFEANEGINHESGPYTNNTAAQITAVDMLPQFLETLMKKAKENNLLDRITAKEMLMDNLTFDKNSFDVIWSEGAIYNIGFEKGLSLWTKYLKDNGFIAVSEISWLTDTRPEEIQQYWVNTYQEIDTIENKLSVNDRKSYNHCQVRNQKIAKERLDYVVNQQKIVALYHQIENDTCE